MNQCLALRSVRGPPRPEKAAPPSRTTLTTRITSARACTAAGAAATAQNIKEAVEDRHDDLSNGQMR